MTSAKGLWTEEEDFLLAKWQEVHGNRWSEVARHIGTKTGQQCAQRWRHRVNPNISKEKWTEAEDNQLTSLVRQYGSCWAEISRNLPGRTDQQCMGRWRRHLDPSVRRVSWHPTEDEKLRELVAEHGASWSFISRFMEGRTAQQVRARWCQLESLESTPASLRVKARQGGHANRPSAPAKVSSSGDASLKKHLTFDDDEEEGGAAPRGGSPVRGRRRGAAPPEHEDGLSSPEYRPRPTTLRTASLATAGQGPAAAGPRRGPAYGSDACSALLAAAHVASAAASVDDAMGGAPGPRAVAPTAAAAAPARPALAAGRARETQAAQASAAAQLMASLAWVRQLAAAKAGLDGAASAAGGRAAERSAGPSPAPVDAPQVSQPAAGDAAGAPELAGREPSDGRGPPSPPLLPAMHGAPSGPEACRPAQRPGEGGPTAAAAPDTHAQGGAAALRPPHPGPAARQALRLDLEHSNPPFFARLAALAPSLEGSRVTPIKLSTALGGGPSLLSPPMGPLLSPLGCSRDGQLESPQFHGLVTPEWARQGQRGPGSTGEGRHRDADFDTRRAAVTRRLPMDELAPDPASPRAADLQGFGSFSMVLGSPPKKARMATPVRGGAPAPAADAAHLLQPESVGRTALAAYLQEGLGLASGGRGRPGSAAAAPSPGPPAKWAGSATADMNSRSVRTSLHALLEQV
ncbi:hypothetical protein ACKKBG_A21265 [Auxenochlorella protothecoides x Auxenochlorella symbiontica]